MVLEWPTYTVVTFILNQSIAKLYLTNVNYELKFVSIFVHETILNTNVHYSVFQTPLQWQSLQH